MSPAEAAYDLGGMIISVRETKVIIDEDLALLYGVPTKVFNQAIKRNLARFPISFRFQLQREELTNLRSQIVTSKGHGGRRYLPYVFTDHGALMAANVLNSPKAVKMSVALVKLFEVIKPLLEPPPETPRKKLGF